MYYNSHNKKGFGDPKPERKEKAKPTPIKKKATGDLASLKDLADALFSNLVKDRDSVNGVAKCFTCPSILKRFEMECGHFAKRGNNKVRWCLLNAHVQCNRCNCVLDGNVVEYGKQLDIRYGKGTADEILRIAKEPFKLDIDFVQEAITEMKNYKPINR